ncbi:transglutaminase-like domain-containing protein [uncultured Proteiniphilum sp.]|uniref:transglutaminase-like domain-containing protein n=1 Tax=uncultured Proteiniphilum sp. TaxID=497637 RepID=UPI002629A6AF|nr:transglutaminase-like domain-containing protein [uncultured Proteiniphilum sp.]
MRTTLGLLILLFLLDCSSPKRQDPIREINKEIVSGNFTRAAALIDSLVQEGQLNEPQQRTLLFTQDSLHRVKLDFNKTKDEIIDWIEKNRLFTPSDSLMDSWERSKTLEFRIIDGEKRYFRNAAPNIFRVDASARELTKILAPGSDTPRDSLLINAFNHKTESEIKGKYLLPKKTMRARYTLMVNADVVPDGEILKAWLPFPRKDVSRQTDVKLLATSPSDYILSDDKTAHTSLYMEQKAVGGKPTVFWIDFGFTSRGEWFDLSEIEAAPYDKSSIVFQTYTAEQKPHIRFSENIRNLTDSVTRNARTPVEILQAVYRYIAAGFPWASALEYSTIANIPEYVVENRKGDCGQVTLLMMTMLRYKGIPARWQSGWMTHPGEVNLHDWAEVYFEGTGWIPVDISFGRGGAVPIQPGQEFFMSGIDSYRLYINSGFSGEFYPGKKYPRSETVDFQRGEVESGQWNLYFDRWKYKMELIYQ